MKTFTRDQPVVVRVTEEFELRLPVLGAAGYQWQVAQTPAEITSVEPPPSAAREEDLRAAEGIGGQFPQRLRFRADREGVWNVRLVCKRPFEPDAAPADELTLRVTVEGHR
jgi:predicted secreted protein